MKYALSHIRQRREQRYMRLRALGYDGYGEYLRSPHWRATRARYRASDRPQACMCGETVVQLHHTTYDRVGADEQIDDLVPLCATCHAMIHALEQRGDVALDFQGFESLQRAALYAKQQAPRIERAKADREPTVQIGDWATTRQAFERDVAAWVASHEAGPSLRNDMRAIVKRLEAAERKLLARLAAQPS